MKNDLLKYVLTEPAVLKPPAEPLFFTQAYARIPKLRHSFARMAVTLLFNVWAVAVSNFLK